MPSQDTSPNPSAAYASRSADDTAAREYPLTAWINRHRLAFIVPAMVTLVLGLYAGLQLLGLSAPWTTSRLAEMHGMLLVAGFLGTLISLERAAAIGQLWGYLSPVGFGIGAVLLFPVPLLGYSGITMGAVVLLAIYVTVWRKQPAAAIAVQALGGVLILAAALLGWAGVSIFALIALLAGFPILTIAGERLELARVAAPRWSAQMLLVALSLGLLLAATATLVWPSLGFRLVGLVLLGLVAWLGYYDVARHTVRSRGLPRYTAWCLLAGYVWLGVAGLIWLQMGQVSPGQLAYDAVIHAVFLGFVISMIFAHAPIILPAVVRCRLPYRPVMYVPVIVLHVSLLVRIGVGDGLNVEGVRLIGAIGNVAAVLLFAAIVLISVRRRP